MGDKNVSNKTDETQIRQFTKAVLNDLQALEKMLDGDCFEENTRRIGAEQEMFLVDSAMDPAPIAMKIIKKAKDKRLTTELGLFNLEANLKPLDFRGNCLSKMERELEEIVSIARKTASGLDSDIVLVGILPTLQQSDFVEENLTPLPRYAEMNRVLNEMHGDERVIQIQGLDEFRLRIENTFVEFANMSFQLHLQVPISEFITHYNWAQAIAAPVLASAVNSPLLLGQRLWHETRLALFQSATDARSPVHQERDHPPRVNFGDKWVDDSMLEVFREDVARFRIILTREIEEDSLKVLESGKIPNLHAWQLHNGTIWRWNRACYGVENDKASLRIEARFLPSGPTIVDEMANSAFFLGLMTDLPQEFGDVREKMSFDDAKGNFFNTARSGLNTQIVWFDDKSYPAKQLILKKLLPLARIGLESAKINSDDIEKYLGIIETRVKAEKSGAQWMLDSLAEMDENEKLNLRLKRLTLAMKENQENGKPLHKWKLAKLTKEADSIENFRTVEQFMSTDLFTVRPEDVVDLAASMMNWKDIRHIPVEDDAGKLVGIVSYHDLLELLANDKLKSDKEIIIRDLMETELTTVAPETSSLEALKLMREKNISCLPVVKGEKLIGLITSDDFLDIS
ncbi:MAG TPA: CBS domain-containing protein, partial [Pyrinomonadaceae bacterium]|nr:CBS domain-containing protein [Pyrinomonadaceae bacterium]